MPQPVTDRHSEKDFIHQQGGTLCHAASTAAEATRRLQLSHQAFIGGNPHSEHARSYIPGDGIGKIVEFLLNV